MRTLTYTVLLALGGLTWSTISRSEPTALPTSVVLSARWSAVCNPQDTSKFFEIAVFGDGKVQYSGGELARVTGMQYLAVSPRRAHKLVDMARHVVEQSPDKHSLLSPKDTWPTICVTVTLQDSTGLRSANLAGGEPAAQRFFRSVAALVADHNLVCPQREPPTVPTPAFDAYGYCGGYDARPAIGFTLIEPGRCYGIGGAVYRDTFYYRAIKLADTKLLVVGGDWYQSVTASQVRSLVRAVSSFQLSRSNIEEPNPSPTQDLRGDTSEMFSDRQQIDLRRLSETIRGVLGSHYPQRDDDNGCRGDKYFGGVSIRPEYLPASRR
jgi:hypothetical protein